MEHLTYVFKGGTRALPRAADVVGVVGSGNLEVLIETAALGGACSIDVTTAAVSISTDFHARWQLQDARIAINDMGATPAVVSLRLDQAVETMLEARP
jgi:malonate decarboxylase delta subunit